MASQEPLVTFYDLAGGSMPWSPFCWVTRYNLNYKGIPYKTVKLSYPDIKATTEKLLGADFETRGLEATVPAIETLPSKAYPTIPQTNLNDSLPIAEFLNQVFTPELGFKNLEGIAESKEYLNERKIGLGILVWILNDVYNNALKGDERGQEYFKTTRESDFKCSLADIEEVHGGGEEKILEGLRGGWIGLKKRMAKEDGNGEPTYTDFKDACVVKWVQAASPEKHEKLLGLYGDDTFVKLMKKTEKYASY